MQIFCLLPLLAALASSVVGAAVRRDDANNCGSEIGCNLGLAKRGDSVQLPTRTVRELTNAERMRRGLPLKPPVRRGSPLRRTDPSSVPGQSLSSDPEPVTEPPSKVTRRGIVKILNAGDGSLLGYIPKALSPGQLFVVNTDKSSALTVTFEAWPQDVTSQMNVIPVDPSNTGYQYLGLVQSPGNADDIGSGVATAGYISLTDGTSPGSPPAKVGNLFSNRGVSSESAVWTFNPITGSLSPQWINTGSSAPATELVTRVGALYFSGDAAAWVGKYPAASNIRYTLQFEDTTV